MNKQKFYDNNEEALKDHFAKDYTGTDDGMVEAFDEWWGDLDDDDVENICL